MGERGPGKTPTKLKLIHGETRPSRINKREPQGKGKPTMPADMSDGATRVWKRVMTTFGDNGVITGADVDVLRAYCEAVDRYEAAAKLIAETGPLVRGARRGELVKNPLHQVVRDNAVLVRTFARELGLTPSARAGIQVPEAVEDDVAKWMAGGAS